MESRPPYPRDALFALDVIQIDRATPEDIEGIASTYVDSAQYHRDLDPELCRVPAVEAVARDLARNWDAPDQTTFVARVDGRVVGSADVRIVRPGRRACMVKPRVVADVGIAVLGPYRRQGVGRRLMEAVEEWARSQGAEKMTLDCHPANSGAISFYESLGFQTTGLLMRKPLDASEGGQVHGSHH